MQTPFSTVMLLTQCAPIHFYDLALKPCMLSGHIWASCSLPGQNKLPHKHSLRQIQWLAMLKCVSTHTPGPYQAIAWCYTTICTAMSTVQYVQESSHGIGHTLQVVLYCHLTRTGYQRFSQCHCCWQHPRTWTARLTTQCLS